MTQWLDRNVCPSCQSRQLKFVHQEDNLKTHNPVLKAYFDRPSVLAECQQCDFAFVSSIPDSPKFYEELYSGTERDVSIDFHHSGKRRIFSEVKRSVLRHRQSGKILDIGAGTGVLLSTFQPEFQGTGVELGSEARKFANTQNLNVIAADLSSLPFADASFDVITLIDVLEHLAKPVENLKEIDRVLKPGGLFYVKVPNYRSQLYKQKVLQFLGLSKEGIMANYIHINHFSPPALMNMLEKMGFETLDRGFSESEVWDLNWREAPKPFWYRLLYNGIVIGISKFLNFLSALTGFAMGLNHFILVKKVKR